MKLKREIFISIINSQTYAIQQFFGRFLITVLNTASGTPHRYGIGADSVSFIFMGTTKMKLMLIVSRGYQLY